jgi:hypothetical protein
LTNKKLLNILFNKGCGCRCSGILFSTAAGVLHEQHHVMCLNVLERDTNRQTKAILMGIILHKKECEMIPYFINRKLKHEKLIKERKSSP